ncbi:hypothetical protein CMI42_01000 [Candidatus Pacearchaeota archaeon]|nr:hypothetical protein [Candidatus Pacearchaeota archaeon]|tara:strand:- start:924 stop:1169 length:246 start_codon:yes stop_codon:yes gene_type:complete
MAIIVEVPQDMREEFGNISNEKWQLLFSKYLREKLNEMQEIDNIVNKSKMTEEQAEKLANEVSLSIYEKMRDNLDAKGGRR